MYFGRFSITRHKRANSPPKNIKRLHKIYRVHSWNVCDSWNLSAELISTSNNTLFKRCSNFTYDIFYAWHWLKMTFKVLFQRFRLEISIQYEILKPFSFFTFFSVQKNLCSSLKINLTWHPHGGTIFETWKAEKFLFFYILLRLTSFECMKSGLDHTP